MLHIKTDIPIRGEFKAYEVFPDGRRQLIYSDHNQIQYIGANVLASALAAGESPSSFPYFSSIKNGKVRQQQLTKADTSFTVFQTGEGFVATPSPNTSSQQTIICNSTFPGIRIPPTPPRQDALYNWGLYITNNATEYLFAYRYIEGGITVGIGSTLDVVWTLYLGSS